MHSRFIITCVCLALTSCSTGYRAEQIDPPTFALENAIAQNIDSNSIMESVDYLPSDWWLLFDDPQLTYFIEKALERNPTLHMAQANILLATYTADYVRARLYPSLFWNGDVSRQKLSQTGVIPFNTSSAATLPVPVPATGNVKPPTIGNIPNTSSAIPVYFTQWETNLVLNYEFDLWGKNRNTLKAALGEVRARIADESFSRLQLSTAVARVYFQLQIDYQRQENALELVKSKSEYLDQVKLRVQENLDSAITVATAEFDLATTQETLLRIQGDIAVNEYQLKAYLADDFEDEIYNIQIAIQPLPKVPIPRELPLNLIAHRPDIVAQLWLIDSAGRQIEVAKAGFYPDLNLYALFGFQTIHLHDLFKKKSIYFDVDNAFSLPIFDGGRLTADLRASEVNYDLAIYQYNSLVLNAAREVLDGIAVLKNSEQQLQVFKSKTGNQKDLLRLTNLRVQYNINSGLNRLTDLGNVYTAKDQELIALGNTLQSVVALIKAIGGGYEACYIDG